MPCVYFPVAAHEAGGDAREEQASSGYRLSWYNAASAQYGDGVNFYSFSFGAGEDCLRQRHKLAMDRNSPRTIVHLASEVTLRLVESASNGLRGYFASSKPLTPLGNVTLYAPPPLFRIQSLFSTDCV